MPSDNTNSVGVGHLADNSIATTYGLVLIVVLVILIVLRLAFADVTVTAKGGA